MNEIKQAACALGRACAQECARLFSRRPAQILLLVVCSLLPSLLLILSSHDDWTMLARYWDGPNYLEVAKTLYHVPRDHPFTGYGTTQAYFACHLPLYPVLIRLFALVFSYPMAMILVTLVTAAAATVAFYYLLLEYKCVQSPLFSAIVSTIIPARWVLYKTIGATEPLFMLLVCLTLLAYKRDKIFWAILLAGLTSITRIVGVLFIVFFLIEFIRTRRYFSITWVPLVLLPLFITFSFFQMQYGDFWAYFSWNSGLINLKPFEVLRSMAGSGDTHGSELYLIFYAIYGLGTLLLWQHRTLFVYALVFFGFNLFVFHGDLSRYLLSTAPFAIVIAYDRILNTPQFKLALPIVFYLTLSYSIGLLPTNLVDGGAYQRFIEQPSYP
ncbi:hypothetical protein [Andreprevotia chitinilytica]|uniref:hypothetical protein n=1 Tax=Andreprevotia chitinilytica TaxID=396808 RepID=UPI00055779E5|nr:hypothetical protein [Andreprevotia chitinilytica]